MVLEIYLPPYLVPMWIHHVHYPAYNTLLMFGKKRTFTALHRDITFSRLCAQKLDQYTQCLHKFLITFPCSYLNLKVNGPVRYIFISSFLVPQSSIILHMNPIHSFLLYASEFTNRFYMLIICHIEIPNGLLLCTLLLLSAATI